VEVEERDVGQQQKVSLCVCSWLGCGKNWSEQAGVARSAPAYAESGFSFWYISSLKVTWRNSYQMCPQRNILKLRVFLCCMWRCAAEVCNRGSSWFAKLVL
jgi:hypothetical protein